MGRGLDDLGVLQSADGEAMANLQRDLKFMGTARSHQYALAIYLRELQKLAETLDSIETRLDQITSGR